MADGAIRALLLVVFPDEQVRQIEITATEFTIGRSPESDLQLPDSKISRDHARLLFEGDQIHLIDLQSANGTFVDDQRLPPNEPYSLEFGEGFRLGPYELRLETSAADTQRPEEAEGAAEDTQERQAEQEPEPEPESEAEGVQLGADEFPGPPEPPEPPAEPEPTAVPDGAELFGIGPAESSYLRYLPPIYGDHPFLGRFLMGLEALWAPIEQLVDHFDFFIDSETTPAFFMEQLATWLGLTLDEKWPQAKRRAVLQEAGELYRWRGTRRGLSRYLEIYTGVEPEIEEAADGAHHFQVTLTVPDEESVDRATVDRIIQANKPAHTTYELELRS